MAKQLDVFALASDPGERLKKMLELAGLPVRGTYRPAEVATLLDVNLTTVYRMMKFGDLDFIEVRSIKRIDYESLVRLIKSKEE